MTSSFAGMYCGEDEREGPKSTPPSCDVSVPGRDGVPDGDRAALQDVRTQAAAVDERPQDPRARQAFEVRARLGEPPADARHRADGEATADQLVEVDAAGDDVAARLFPRQPHVGQHL